MQRHRANDKKRTLRCAGSDLSFALLAMQAVLAARLKAAKVADEEGCLPLHHAAKAASLPCAQCGSRSGPVGALRAGAFRLDFRSTAPPRTGSGFGAEEAATLAGV